MLECVSVLGVCVCVCVCVCVRERQPWQVSYASAAEEIHFTSPDSIKGSENFQTTFCDTLNKSLTSELSVPSTD